MFAVRHLFDFFAHLITLNSFMKRKVSFWIYQRQLNKKHVYPILQEFWRDPTPYLRPFTKPLGHRKVIHVTYPCNTKSEAPYLKHFLVSSLV